MSRSDALRSRINRHSPAETEAEHLILELGHAVDELTISNERLKRKLLEVRLESVGYCNELVRCREALSRIASLMPDADQSAKEIALETLGVPS